LNETSVSGPSCSYVTQTFVTEYTMYIYFHIVDRYIDRNSSGCDEILSE